MRCSAPLRFVLVLLSAGAIRQAAATDLPSSSVGYVLDPSGNPYVVPPDAVIDTRAVSGDAILASSGSGWDFTNRGQVLGSYHAIELGNGTLTNYGTFGSVTTTTVVMWSGGTVINARGALIAGKLDGIFLPNRNSVIINAGVIDGTYHNLADTQAGIHMPDGGTIDNAATGRIFGHANGIMAAPGTTVTNAGVIAADIGAAIDLSSGSAAPGAVTNSGTILGTGGNAILFGPADDRLVLTGTSRIVGIVDGGASASAGNTLVLGGAEAGSFDVSSLDPGAQYRNFGILQKQGSGTWTLTGGNSAAQAWQVGSGGIVVAGQLAGSLTALPEVSGLAITVAAGGALRAPSGSAITVNDASRIDNQAGGVIASGQAPAITAGAGATIANAGAISSEGGPAITTGTGATIANSGAISGNGGPAITAGAGATIANSGTLAGNGVALRLTGEASTVSLDTGSAISGDLDGSGGAGNALVLLGSGGLPGSAYGFETLAMRGTAWSLDGAVQAGATTVETGTLAVAGTLTSPAVTVAPGAALAGTGTIAGNVGMAGTIAPGVPPSADAMLSIGTLSVAGRYEQASSTVYRFDASHTGSDLVDVTGAAALSGGIVRARLRALALTAPESYRILSASDGLTGTFAGVESFNPFVRVSLDYDASNAYLRVARSFVFAGGTPNQIAVEKALDHGAFAEGADAPSDDFVAVAVQLMNLEGAAAYAAVDQLSAEAYAQLPNAHFAAARAGMNAIDARLAGGGADDSCTGRRREDTPQIARTCGWATVLGNTGRIGGYDTWLSQDINLAGVMAGLDYAWTPAFTSGAAFGYLHGNTFTHSLPVHGQFDSYQAIVYGRYATGPYWFRGALGYARNIDEMRRDILFTDMPREARGGRHGNQFFTTLRTGFDVPGAVPGVLAPFAGVEAQLVKLSGVTEAGADAVGLVLPSSSDSSIRSLLGTEWRYVSDAWRIDAAVAWVHTFGTNTLAIDARFAGAPASAFTVHGSGQNRNAVQLRLGAGFRPTLRTSVSFRYDGELGTHGSTHGGAISVSYRW